MKKVIITMLAAAVIINSPAAFASNWIEIGRTQDSSTQIEIDKDSIKHSGPVVKVWVREITLIGAKLPGGGVLTGTRTPGGLKYDTLMNRQTIDCSQGTVTFSSTEYFDHGSVVEAREGTESGDIPPDTIPEIVERAVCKSKS
ncbi:surface-adhesin E family protein [Paraburkholderia guartelaensis]|uniref:surface-adhesin E family protein n=1 Tax=Paraburkholderia guartelaensis TaxID=2546446 RepID=UPI002AB6173D|nr:surface-adhesin E family protein [Paraburkholderia guartelaensis]